MPNTEIHFMNLNLHKGYDFTIPSKDIGKTIKKYNSP